MQLMMGDCLERMVEIEDGSVDAVICDPPYGTMMGLNDVSHGMSGKTDWDEALNPAAISEKCSRVLRPNGVLILFSQEPYTSRLINEALSNLPFSYRMIWEKDHFANSLVAKKAPVSYFEDIVVFAKRHVKHDFDYANPLHNYAAMMFDFIGLPRKKIFSEMGHQGAFHWFLGQNSVQFSICTERTYDQLCEMYGVRRMPGFREYLDLKEENDAFKAGLISSMNAKFPKVFNLPQGKKYKSNILRYKKDYTGHHPTQKPVALMEDLIRTYTNERETVLDFTMGSGTTGVACANTDRNFIGIERDPTYFQIAKDRIEEAQRRLL